MEYDFITKYFFPYYCKQENQAWKNSICHHLSIHKCFVKLSLKGGKNRSRYRMLDNQHEVMFEEGNYTEEESVTLSRRALLIRKLTNQCWNPTTEDFLNAPHQTAPFQCFPTPSLFIEHSLSDLVINLFPQGDPFTYPQNTTCTFIGGYVIIGEPFYIPLHLSYFHLLVAALDSNQSTDIPL